MRAVLAVVVYLGGWCAILFTGLQQQGSDAATIPLAIVASIAAGAVARSWWAVLLAGTLPALSAIDGCDGADNCEVDPAWLALVLWTAPSAALIAAGVALGRLGRRSRGGGAGGSEVAV